MTNNLNSNVSYCPVCSELYKVEPQTDACPNFHYRVDSLGSLDSQGDGIKYTDEANQQSTGFNDNRPTIFIRDDFDDSLELVPEKSKGTRYTENPNNVLFTEETSPYIRTKSEQQLIGNDNIDKEGWSVQDTLQDTLNENYISMIKGLLIKIELLREELEYERTKNAAYSMLMHASQYIHTLRKHKKIEKDNYMDILFTLDAAIKKLIIEREKWRMPNVYEESIVNENSKANSIILCKHCNTPIKQVTAFSTRHWEHVHTGITVCHYMNNSTVATPMS